MDLNKVEGEISIEDGKIIFHKITLEGKLIMDPNDMLITLRDVLHRQLKNYEKDFQKQFLPNENTKYNLPKD